MPKRTSMETRRQRYQLQRLRWLRVSSPWLWTRQLHSVVSSQSIYVSIMIFSLLVSSSAVPIDISALYTQHRKLFSPVIRESILCPPSDTR